MSFHFHDVSAEEIQQIGREILDMTRKWFVEDSRNIDLGRFEKCLLFLIEMNRENRLHNLDRVLRNLINTNAPIVEELLRHRPEEEERFSVTSNL